ncbi:hypothetical protein E2P81_ATG08258 [Venturia nashicola]|uniref:Uncharacterized protein n=1 Tax=Venturia nashicola TaxID=86259 RepID=A0A4Z1NQA2_9PEZI|nr:hypothetical protein E6O75_ATG08438 [Venturia nashicola]TLD21670.1 hypothetical protein E2P81_ATG08258 [Venturia nashicola]
MEEESEFKPTPSGADSHLLRSRLSQHLRLLDEDGRESQESYRDVSMREKGAGDPFGPRAIEAGYFGGVAQSTNDSPNLTPRGSMISQTLHDSQDAISLYSSSTFDPENSGMISTADSDNNHTSTARQTSLKLPLSPTIPSIAYAIRKTPSPTGSPSISPAYSPIQVPSMAHIRQIALRPSTAERHSHGPPNEMPIDFRFESLQKTMLHPELLIPPQPQQPEVSRRHARIFSASDMVTWLDNNEAPQLLLPAFIGSSDHLVPEFDRSKSNRTSGISINTIPAKRKSIDDEPLPEPKPKRISMMKNSSTPTRRRSRSSLASSQDKSIAENPTPLINTCSAGKHFRREAIVPERVLELPASTAGLRAPIPSVIVENGRFYFDYSKPLTLALPVRSHLSPASSKASRKVTSQQAPRAREDLDADGDKIDTPRKSLTLTLPTRSPMHVLLKRSKISLTIDTESEPRLSEGWSEDGDGDVTPRASAFSLAPALPVRSPLRPSPASSRSTLKSRGEETSC